MSSVLPLEMSVAAAGTATVLSVRGEVDIMTATSLRERLLELLELPAGGLVVDLAEVPFLDSTGLGVLIAAFKRATTAGVGMSLARPQRIVANALSLVRIDAVLPVHDSVDDAIRSVGGTPPIDLR